MNVFCPSFGCGRQSLFYLVFPYRGTKGAMVLDLLGTIYSQGSLLSFLGPRLHPSSVVKHHEGQD